MPVNVGAVRVTAVLVVFALLYGSRLSTGTAKLNADKSALIFAMKPFVVFARVAALLLYLGFFGYTILTQGRALPLWFPALFLLAVGFSLLQFPGTIVLRAEEMTQHFWFLKLRRIRYDGVSAIQAFAAGRAVRVVGANGTLITHTNNHSAAAAFREEMERRTGQRVQG